MVSAPNHSDRLLDLSAHLIQHLVVLFPSIDVALSFDFLRERSLTVHGAASLLLLLGLDGFELLVRDHVEFHLVFQQQLLVCVLLL